MRAGLPKKEPEILARWETMDLYGRLRAQSAGREKWILHDGPPYANGNIHIGTAANKILKDIVSRSYQMLGYDANYVPGWDCHGLPIEWKVEERYRAEGKDKDAVPVLDLRRECRAFADEWIGVQAEEFKRLGVIGDWQRPYTTMTPAAEAQIVREIHRFVTNGGLYRGLKPVLWSVVEKTALAEAEVEYADHVSTTCWVRFPVAEASLPALEGASAVIWTTTPWTLPANRAIAYGEEIDYRVITVDAVDPDKAGADGPAARVGETLVVAAALADDVLGRAGVTESRVEATVPGRALAGTVCRHPLAGQGYDHPVRLLPADFVTTDQGTGLVHIAPGHGEDDYELGLEHGVEWRPMVAEDGRYLDSVPLFAGKAIYTADGKKGEADGAVLAAIGEAGGLLARGKLTHSYPHSWRSKAPLIFRATSQWFISMDTGELREKALKALSTTRFVPAAGKNRLTSMIEQRPDWCISRQRAWGVPIAIFVNKATGEILRDDSVLGRIAEIFEEEGSDAWFARPASDFLGPDHDGEAFEQVFDIVDVWFESGSTHAFVLEHRDDLKWPADLYLEGSDQHRGWFHSSLLESCGTRGRAPYESVLTHGFVLDGEGRKMSKSLGNTVAPQDVVTASGADILRLWVVGSDFTADLKIGDEIVKYHADSYRRLRNTLRYLLGALSDFDPAERVTPEEMPELERWVLHRLTEMDALVRKAVADLDYHEMATALHTFCNHDLSAFYLDVRKDVLYCDRPDGLRRRAVRTVLDRLFDCLTAWLAPVLCFTAEEAWWTRNGEAAGSVHERVFPTLPESWRDETLAAKWRSIRQVRRVVTGAMELERAEKRIGASLQAHPTVYVTADVARDVARVTRAEDIDLAEICIVSGIRVETGEAPADAYRLAEVPGVAVVAGLAEGEKCQRCWKVLPEVGEHGHPDLCGRCADAVDHLRSAAA
ncbi:MAG: isoleucine--tRNA ligase [Azospirillaceae bacterium]